MTATATLDLCDELTVAVAPALASHARVVVRTHAGGEARGCDPALAVLRAVNRACSRFDPDSELRRVNADPSAWHSVGTTGRTAIREGWWAYRRTSGEFDPRLHAPQVAGQERAPWHPCLDDGAGTAHVGGIPLDLDAIARGLALRWCGRALRGTHHLVEVGDSCWCGGLGPDGAPWRIGLRDPLGDPSPLAVLDLVDMASATCAASRARIAGQPVGQGLLSVTVVGPDSVAAEVWSMVLLAASERGIAEVAERRRLPVAWVTDAGELHTSPALGKRIGWQR